MVWITGVTSEARRNLPVEVSTVAGTLKGRPKSLENDYKSRAASPGAAAGAYGIG